MHGTMKVKFAYSTFLSMCFLQFVNFVYCCRLLDRYMKSASHTGRFMCEWLEQVIFLYVASTVALPLKLLFRYRSCGCTFKCSVSDIVRWIKHLRSFSHITFCEYKPITGIGGKSKGN